jgi:prefoldin alpha subunit
MDNNKLNIKDDNLLKKREQELSQKYIDYQMLEEQLKNIENQLKLISDNLLEIKYITESIDEISKLEKDRIILSPVSPGIFVKAKIQNPGTFYVNVGNNVVVKKNLEESKELMSIQQNEMKNSKEILLENINILTQKMIQLEKYFVSN